MPKHGEVRKIYEQQQLVMNKQLIDERSKSNKSIKNETVIELSRLETYIIKEVYCAKCEAWQETDSRYAITDIVCPNCCVRW
ncbi:hypothetical protein [Caryophanon tenue]|uniref:Uncharacterized protein n=1 Tax=Caryophanon tenue TaxID=33978 RepID=A0A1C0YJ08_9BACL|nr:hypothetical protein [Caryophanon tenue]OCS87160.1 hypothetical protein A6M13_11040 [Caryophanon tenue]